MKGMALPCGFYMNELIMRLLHRHDVHEDVYDLYQQTLYALSRPDSVEIELRLFEKNLLQLLGFGLNLNEDADTGDGVDASMNYMYYIEHGPVAVRTGQVDSHHLVISGQSLQAYDQNDLSSSQTRKEIKSLMRYVLSYYLGEKPLKSRELFR
jgi:DNA repair protein RecO (recombination protein O)